MLLVQEDQSCSAPDSTVGLLGKPPSPARNSQGCWKPENFTFTQYFISDIPFFSPLWCWQWQDEKAFWEPLPPAARHSCQPWTIFKKSLFNPGSTNSAKVITCQVCTKLLSITCKEVESDKDKEYTKIKKISRLFQEPMIQKLVFKLKIQIPLLRLPLFFHFWICKVERSQTHLGQESLPGFMNYFFIVVFPQNLLYIQYRTEITIGNYQ